jgi:autotransporter-associated beta strand protein
MDRLDRGLVATSRSGASGNLVSWRIFGNEYYDVTYNLYCNGTLLKSGLTASNFAHTSGNANSVYEVAAVVRGKEQGKCAPVKRWEHIDGANNPYWRIPVKPAYDRNGADASSHYALNDVSVADLTGDGKMEFIVKRPCDAAVDPAQKIMFHHVDCYDLNGNQLWWIDMGPNMIGGPDEQWDVVTFDWDMDGKAEVLFRAADGTVIHYPDGTTYEVGNMTVDTRWAGIEYTPTGNEYLLYLEGATGKPYSIGPDAHPGYMNYPIARGQDADWGSGVAGHRSTKHYWGAPYLDGHKPSIFLGRGCYTMHKMVALDVVPETHKLVQRWWWECTIASWWAGCGYHNFAIADVDWDGRDEIVFGSMVLDDNGKGLHTCGLGHGDAQHCGDLNPYRHGQEQFACNENAPSCNLRDATTGEFLYRLVGTGDDGRAMAANITNDYPGAMAASTGSGIISCVSGKVINGWVNNWYGGNDPMALNFRTYWDGDLLEETINSPGIERECIVLKSGSGRIFTSYGCKMNNWTKNQPCFSGDIMGDWREELVLRAGDNTELRIYPTTIPTQYRIPTLWHDHQYRQGMMWQCMGYNQPAHTSFFLGELEGITQAPPPLTNTDRTLVANGGQITTTDEHLLVNPDEDATVSISDGASPYMVTFNIPSWTQGQAGSNQTARPEPVTTYYKCVVTGGALTGSTRVVKQGDGILTLPKADMTYTGETDVWAGVLNFDGTLKNSPLWLNRFAELNSDGGTFKSIKADYAAIIRPGGEDNIGSITTDVLELGFGSRIILDMDGSQQKCDQLNTKTIKIEKKTGDNWEMYGPEHLSPVIEVRWKNEEMKAGTYVIGDAEAVAGDLKDILIEGVTKMKRDLTIEDGKLVLTIAETRQPSIVYWTGAEGTQWDYASTMNFSNEGTPDYFVSGDKVVLDDAAQNFNIKLSGLLDPETIIVKGDKNYTISGTGDITGNTSLVKEGTGTLTLGSDFSYTGPTLISGGTVKVSSLSHANQKNGNLGAMSTAADHITIKNGAVLHTTAEVTMGSSVNLATAEGGVVRSDLRFIMNGVFSGTRLTKSGGGNMVLYGVNNKLDTLCVKEGVLTVASSMPAKCLELAGGEVCFNLSNSTPIYVPKGKSAVIRPLLDRSSYQNRLTGAGTVTISYPLVDGGAWRAERCSMSGNWSQFEGTIKPISGFNGDERFVLDNNYGAPKATFDLAANVVVLNTAKEYAIAKVTGEGRLGGVCTLGGNVSGLNTWKIGCDDNFTFNGKIIDDANFVKQGSGKMTFKGSGTFTGTAKINGGELCLNSNGSEGMLGTGALTVAKGATLSGKGVLTNSSTTISSGGTLRSGITETNALGNLQFSGKSLTVVGTISTYIGSKTSYSKFTNIKNLTIRSLATIIVNGRETLALKEGDEIKLFDAEKVSIHEDCTLQLCAPNMEDPTLVWNTDRLYTEGVLVVTKGDASAIDHITTDMVTKGMVYTLSGMRVVGEPERGKIYIVNGKKVYVK